MVKQVFFTLLLFFTGIVATAQTMWSLHFVPGYQSEYSLANYEDGYKHKDYTFFDKKNSL